MLIGDNGILDALKMIKWNKFFVVKFNRPLFFSQDMDQEEEVQDQDMDLFSRKFGQDGVFTLLECAQSIFCIKLPTIGSFLRKNFSHMVAKCTPFKGVCNRASSFFKQPVLFES